MAQTWEFIERLPFPPQIVMETMTDADFVARFSEFQGGRNARARVVEETDTKKILQVDMELYIDLIKTSKNATLHLRWDKTRRRNTWEQTGSGATVSGESILEADGEGTKWTERGSISVPMPIIGKKIEKKVIEVRDRGRSRNVAFLREAITQRQS